MDARTNEAANYVLNSARKLDMPAYDGYYTWVKIFVEDQNNVWFSQTDWRFEVLS